jgi:alanyl-tRNA synthetase
MTKKLYLHEGAPLQGEVRIIGINTSGSHPIIRVDRTLFHPKGGGQLAYRGLIGSARVVDVRHAESGEVDHFVDSVDGLNVNDIVTISVDAEHRHANTRLHTAGHLIAGVMATPFREFVPVGAHHYPGECRVEFKGAATSLDRLRDELPKLVIDTIALDFPVAVLGEPEVNRSIQIGAFPAISCGGTHLSRLSPLVRIEITSVKLKDGKIRVSYSL